MTRTLRGGEKDDGRFDLDFWRKVGAEGIFAAAWEMVTEAEPCGVTMGTKDLGPGRREPTPHRRRPA